MTAQLRLVTPGQLATVQDLGRFGYRRIGVPQSGVLHPGMANIANDLAGNDEGVALIEFFLVGPSFRLEKGTVRLAFAGDFAVELTRRRIRRRLFSWRSLTLQAGDSLKLGPVTSGKAGYVAIAGGFDLPPVMGSFSTYLRGGFGGINGARLQPNTLLPLSGNHLVEGPDKALPPQACLNNLGLARAADEPSPETVRVVLGPQEDYFTPEARKEFLSASYRISRDSDRMGSRLEGPVLAHSPDRKPEIISDGIVPGAIQVPGNGSPIVLLADGPTVGGYPKIATVISADLGRFSVLTPGSEVRFAAVTQQQAALLLREQRTDLDGLQEMTTLVDVRRGAYARPTGSIKLISGVIDTPERTEQQAAMPGEGEKP